MSRPSDLDDLEAWLLGRLHGSQRALALACSGADLPDDLEALQFKAAQLQDAYDLVREFRSTREGV